MVLQRKLSHERFNLKQTQLYFNKKDYLDNIFEEIKEKPELKNNSSELNLKEEEKKTKEKSSSLPKKFNLSQLGKMLKKEKSKSKTLEVTKKTFRKETKETKGDDTKRNSSESLIKLHKKNIYEISF